MDNQSPLNLEGSQRNNLTESRICNDRNNKCKHVKKFRVPNIMRHINVIQNATFTNGKDHTLRELSSLF